jgi:hypothetical protein
MAPEINVGQADRVIRIILGLVCVGLVAYHFLREPILPIYAIIGLVTLIAYFLKTGYTRVCPIMKSLNVSTTKKQN